MATYALPAHAGVHRVELHDLLDRAVHHPTDGKRYAEAAEFFTRYQPARQARENLLHITSVYFLYLDHLLPADPSGASAGVAAVRRLARSGAVAEGLDGIAAQLTAAVRDGVGAQAARMVATDLDPATQTMLLLTMFAVLVELVEAVSASRGFTASALLGVIGEQFA